MSTLPSLDLGSIAGEAIFDDIFAGPGGVAMELLKMGGTQVTLIFPGEQGEYDRETDSYPNQKPDETYTVPFVKNAGFVSAFISLGGSRAIRTQANGTMTEVGNMVGYIPANEITTRLKPHETRMFADNQWFIIDAIEEIKSGKEIAAFQIVAKKAL